MSKPINGGSFMPETLEDMLMAIAVKDSAPEGVDVGIYLSSSVMKDIALRIRELENRLA
jgi:hypothetical protein